MEQQWSSSHGEEIDVLSLRLGLCHHASTSYFLRTCLEQHNASANGSYRPIPNFLPTEQCVRPIPLRK
eukprot:3605379-Amphidinium_carterae.2